MFVGVWVSGAGGCGVLGSSEGLGGGVGVGVV